jgi:hypothetical protein
MTANGQVPGPDLGSSPGRPRKVTTTTTKGNRMQSVYVRTEFAEVAGRQFDGEIVVEDPDNSDGGTGVVALQIQNFNTGDRPATAQLDRDQLAQLLTALQARA